MIHNTTGTFDLDGQVTREAVLWAYRFFLGRDPESEAVIERCLSVASVTMLRKNIMKSVEFQSIVTHSAFSAAANPVVRCRQQNGLFLYIDLRDRLVSMGCLMGQYEPIETRCVLSRLEDGDGFVDMGANIGWFTCHAASKVGKTGRVWAFEPRSEAFAMLEASVRDNAFSDRVSLFRCGLLDRRTHGTLRWQSSNQNQGEASLSEAIPDVGHKSERIPLDKLDNFAFDRRIRLIKIDVEGSEYLAIKGAMKTITKDSPIILSEVSTAMLAGASHATPGQYMALLEPLGYRAYALTGDGLTSIIDMSDFLATRGIANVVFERGLP